jgi:hypothetical protein
MNPDRVEEGRCNENFVKGDPDIIKRSQILLQTIYGFKIYNYTHLLARIRPRYRFI